MGAMAQQKTLPGQDLMEAKFDAKSQQAIQQLKELGGGSAATLGAVADVLGGQDEYARDLAIEAAGMQRDAQKAYAGAQMQAPSVYSGMAGYEANMGMGLGNMMNQQANQIAAIGQQGMAARTQADMAGQGMITGATGQYGDILSQNLGQQQNLGQYGIGLGTRAGERSLDIARQQQLTDLDIQKYGIDAETAAQFQKAAQEGRHGEVLAGMTAEDQARVAQAMQDKGIAAGRAGEMMGQGEYMGMNMAGQAEQNWMNNMAAAQGQMGDFYMNQGQNVADYSMQGANMMANAGMWGAQNAANLTQGYGDAAYRYGGDLANANWQGATTMADAYGTAGDRNIYAAGQGYDMNQNALNQWQLNQTDYTNARLNEEQRMFQNNQIDPYNSAMNFYQQDYFANDPMAYQMQLWGNEAGMDYARYNQGLAKQAANDASSNEMWGNVGQLAGTALAGPAGGAAGGFLGNQLSGGNAPVSTGYNNSFGDVTRTPTMNEFTPRSYNLSNSYGMSQVPYNYDAYFYGANSDVQSPFR